MRWRPRLRHPLLWVAGAVALAAIGTVSAIALTRGSGDSQVSADATVSAQAAASATAVAQIAAENPGGWYDAGPLFFVDGTTQPVVSSSVRALYTVVTLAGPGLIKLDAGNVNWSGSNNGNLALTAMINGRWDAVSLLGGPDTSLLVDSSTAIRFFGINGNERPVLIVRVSPYHSNPAQESFASADGRFFFDPKGTPDDAVVNQDTGEELDVSQTASMNVGFWLGVVTNCGGDLSADDGGRCSVYWGGNNPLPIPVDGTLSCAPSGQWKLVAPAFVLYFAGNTVLAGGLSPVACDLTGSKVVGAGVGQIGGGATSFVITATTNDPALAPDQQKPLSVAFGGSTMYVGPIHLTVGCPCMLSLGS